MQKEGKPAVNAVKEVVRVLKPVAGGRGETSGVGFEKNLEINGPPQRGEVPMRSGGGVGRDVEETLESLRSGGRRKGKNGRPGQGWGGGAERFLRRPQLIGLWTQIMGGVFTGKK